MAPTGLASYRDCWLQKLLNPPLGRKKGSFHMNLPLQRNGSIHPVRPTPMSLCRTGEPPGTGYSALLHL